MATSTRRISGTNDTHTQCHVNPSQSPMCLKECPTPCVRPPTLPTCYTTPPRAIPPMRHLVTTTDGYNKGICGRRWSGVGEVREEMGESAKTKREGADDGDMGDREGAATGGESSWMQRRSCPAFPNERMPSRRMSHLQAGPTKGVAAPLVTILGLNLNVTEYRSNSLPVTLQVRHKLTPHICVWSGDRRDVELMFGGGLSIKEVGRRRGMWSSCKVGGAWREHLQLRDEYIAHQSALGNEDRRQGREIQENPSGAEGRPGFFPVVPPSAAQARKVEVEVEGVSRLMKKGWWVQFFSLSGRVVYSPFSSPLLSLFVPPFLRPRIHLTPIYRPILLFPFTPSPRSSRSAGDLGRSRVRGALWYTRNLRTTCGSGDYPALLVEGSTLSRRHFLIPSPAEARAEGDEWSMERAGLYGERLRIVVLEDSFDKRHQ
ncbi:hypothetical protein FA13DRAFT_1722645 [Coprinellus micaceus]|uniref:Uncharacterized protein n=1 Tax=Coprinellus micaceus TaxID=71717 RepID=A0A4Y7RK78_COPMI|nr:hypothetical protein FA13DRAFT_1722645 [Coprinellus micaceus]